MKTVVGRGARAAQVDSTRQQILATAERLFAEHGLYAVSNRQISASAGQGNNAAVGYHFGTKADLVRAIIVKHTEPMERLRLAMVEAVGDGAGLREWVDCLVRPVTTHLDSLGGPTWYARFGAQVMTDPAFRAIMSEEALATPGMRLVLEGLQRSLPGEVPAQARLDRAQMLRHLMVHVVAERERALAEGVVTPRGSWDDAATGLVDAITGLLLAPVTA